MKTRQPESRSVARTQSPESDSAAALVEGIFNGLAGGFRNILGSPTSRRPPQQDLLTYQEVVSYFVNEHPGDARIEAGALLRRPHAHGQLIFQVFLDGADDVCLKQNGDAYGRVLFARQLDPELGHLLAEEDLVVFR